MTDPQLQKILLAFQSLENVLMTGFSGIEMRLAGIGKSTEESRKLIDSLRKYTLGKIDRGG